VIKHIVLWKLKEPDASDSKEDYANQIKQELEALPKVIPALHSLEVGININPSEAADDVVLVTSFQRASDLDAYQIHPAHQAAAAVIRNLVSSRRVVDFETLL